MKILITGATGVLSGLVAARLAAGHELIGMDVRPLRDPSAFPGTFYQVERYNQRQAAEPFRLHKPDALIHLGVRAEADVQSEDRFTQNVLGTRYLLGLVEHHQVSRVVALGTYHVYGAHQHNTVNMREDALLRAAQTFPELVDVVELDHTVTNFLWRHRRIKTVLLRFANIVGPRLNNRISRLLRMRYCPRLMGFNPMMQFIHESDAASAVVAALGAARWGIYNVAGEGALPWGKAIWLAGAKPLPVVHLLAYPVVRALARWNLFFPAHLIDYFRYPTIIDDSAFREAFGWHPELSMVETLGSLRLVEL